MTTACPNCGHRSEDAEWCDNCGHSLAAAAAPPARPPRHCPVCGEPEEGRYCGGCGHDFAGGTPGDGPISGDTALSQVRDPAPDPVSPAGGPVLHDDTVRAETGLSNASVPSGPSAEDTGFAVVVSADRAFHARLAGDPAAAPFPPYAPDRTVPLTRREIRIGRGRRGGDDRPEIDLSEPPADLAVSHLHAVLLREGDGWTAVDLGSYNGTRLDGERLRPNSPEPFRVGSTLHLGAWTAIRLESASREGAPR